MCTAPIGQCMARWSSLDCATGISNPSGGPRPQAEIDVIPLSTEVSSPVSPSKMIDQNSTSHLGRQQQAELLAVLDRYSECFSDAPGLTDVIKYSIPLVPGFKPQRLHAYRVPK